MTKSTQHKIEYYIVRILLSMLNLLPLKLALRFGDFIGFLAFSVLKIRRDVSLANLKISFGAKYADKEYRRIALRSYINFARSMVEFGMFPRISKMKLPDLINTINDEIVAKHFDSGAGAVIVSGHFGNFELMGAYMAQVGWPIDFLVGKQRNLLVNSLMNNNRAVFGAGLIEIGVAARGVFTALKKGRGVVMLSDQDTGSDGVIIDFLGRPASTPKGPAAFAIKTGCPIFVFMPVRNSLIKHTLYFEGPLTIAKSDNKDEDIKKLTQAYSDIIAKYVAEHPEHYFWAHRRWKTTCPEDYP
ncbi:MAG: lysophospholipid acyltransferase family protein [candidate division Zixibacteria bacterium]|nr:lysophospholipid acyltransferase family protein [candidate division Zixibacteria bacterium]